MSVGHDQHPAFPGGARVALVQRVDAPGLFGVAMRHGLKVVPLPDGYDYRTKVGWVDGWIFVEHPAFPVMLADTTTGTLSEMNEAAYSTLMANYTYPKEARA